MFKFFIVLVHRVISILKVGDILQETFDKFNFNFMLSFLEESDSDLKIRNKSDHSISPKDRFKVWCINITNQ